MIFRNTKTTEIEILTQIHLAAFKDFFLATLGRNFLNAYYKSCLKSKETINVCVENEEGIMVGFGVGCIQSKGFHKRLLIQNFHIFFTQGLIILFSRPKAIIRLLKNMDKKENINDDGNYCDLLSIAVLPEFNGLGIGKGLINKFEEEATKRGCTKIALTTDYYNNDDVITFYKKSGYEVFYEFTTYPNRRMFKLTKKL